MLLYNLGKIGWSESQLIYHALARLGREALVLVSPRTPYVCLGFHQDVSREVDLDFCREQGLPVFRRDVGGGCVLLDGDQLFFQLILDRKSRQVPLRREIFYRKYLEPVINVYRRLGVKAEYKPINDLIVGGRKICGSGAGEIESSVVFVGNLILDFDCSQMARILKTPDEEYRRRLAGMIEKNMTTIRRELGTERASAWDEAALNQLMAAEFEKVLGPLTPVEVDGELKAEIDELAGLMINDQWLKAKGRRIPGRVVKVRSGVNLVRKSGLIRGRMIEAEYELNDDLMIGVRLSADPEVASPEVLQKMEKALDGRPGAQAPGVLAELFGAIGAGEAEAAWLEILSV